MVRALARKFAFLLPCGRFPTYSANQNWRPLTMSTATAMAPALKPSDLMRECGSKTGQWKPESPDHWRWQLKNGEGTERALAWVKLNSVGRGSPHCVNAAGEPLRVEHLALDCGWTSQTATNYCAQLVKEGRIELVHGKRIKYRADVPEKGRKQGEGNKSVQGYFPEYLIEFIKTLPADKKAKVEAYSAWRKRYFAEVMAAARSIDEQVQDSMLLAVGVKKKRLPKRRPIETNAVQLSLVETPAFLNSVQSDSVQGGDPTSYTAESGSVQGGPIFIDSGALIERNPSVGRSVLEDRPTDPDMKGFLLKSWGALFPGDEPSAPLCLQIVRALQGAPLALLGERMRQRASAATGFGFALALATEVGKRYLEGAADRDLAAGESKAKAVAEQDRNRRFYRSVLEDPHASADEKKMAAEFLEMNPVQSAAVTRREAERILADPNSYADDKAWAREVLKTERAKAQGG